MQLTKDNTAFYRFELSSINRIDVNEWSNTHLERGLNYLGKILSVLYETGLFRVTSVVISRSHLRKGNIILGFHSPNNNPLTILDEVKEFMMAHENSGFVELRGTTKIENPGGKIEWLSAIQIYFFMTNLSLELGTKTDAWLPLDREGNLQIDLAEINAPRFKELLESIRSEVGYDQVYPAENEAVWEELQGQKGFNIYINEDITQREDFPKEKYDVVQKYLWKNRDN